MSKKYKTMLMRMGLNYTAAEREFQSVEIFRVLVHREIAEPLFLGPLKEGYDQQTFP